MVKCKGFFHSSIPIPFCYVLNGSIDYRRPSAGRGRGYFYFRILLCFHLFSFVSREKRVAITCFLCFLVG